MMNSKLESLPGGVQILLSISMSKLELVKQQYKTLILYPNVTTYHHYYTIPYAITCIDRDRSELRL